MRYFVTYSAFNKHNYPDMVGQILTDPPSYLSVRPVITCCGSDLVCEHFTNTCDHCGADYNFAGQTLAPRSQWGEETGEHWSECI